MDTLVKEPVHKEENSLTWCPCPTSRRAGLEPPVNTFRCINNKHNMERLKLYQFQSIESLILTSNSNAIICILTKCWRLPVLLKDSVSWLSLVLHGSLVDGVSLLKQALLLKLLSPRHIDEPTPHRGLHLWCQCPYCICGCIVWWAHCNNLHI